MTIEFDFMTTDELFLLHEEIVATLERMLIAKKNVLEGRLKRLQPPEKLTQLNERRPYPAVNPKFRNPAQSLETWSGRGKRPRWLDAQLRSGKRIDDFRIEPALL